MIKQTRRLQRLIRQGESETLEFKESFGKDVIETICAFGNSTGGRILVGVDDRGKVKGTTVGKDSLRDWSNQVAQGTGMHPSFQALRLNKNPIVVMTVHESRIKPVMFHGKAFKRSGSATRQMNLEELTRVALSSVGTTWDALPELRAKPSDISLAKVRDFIRQANRQGRRPVPSGTAPLQLLKKLDLLQEGRPTRAALLLFGKNPQHFYSQSLVKIGRFRDENLIVDDRRIGGTLFNQVEETMNYFRDRLETRFVMTGRPAREVVWEYPLEALREAVTNAVCHRDYLSPRDTEVRIYDERLRVWNDGGLPPPLSMKDLEGEHSSFPRNKKVAEIFFYAGLIEQWGSGIHKMREDCRKAGMPAPLFEETQGFRVTFQKARDEAPHKHRTSTAQAPHKVLEAFPPEDRIKLLRVCAEPRKIEEIMSALGLRHRVHFMRKHIHPLLKEGLLTMTVPEAPNSPKQRYIATQRGTAVANPRLKN
jgi:ATP-dependent DNA helicase RecG